MVLRATWWGVSRVLWLTVFLQFSIGVQFGQEDTGTADPQSSPPYWLGKLPRPIVDRPGRLPADPSEAAVDWRQLRVSAEEWKRWKEIREAPDLETMAGLAARFLADYPETALAPNLHGVLASYAYQIEDHQAFITHAEGLLESRPGLPDLLIQLSLVLIQEGKRVEALQRAREAVKVLNQLKRTEGIDSGAWLNWIFRLRSEANFALGRAHLLKRMDASDPTPIADYEAALTFLKLALHFLPSHEGASFWLGYVQRNRGQAGSALLSFGRTMALNGPFASHAQAQLEEIREVLLETDPNSPANEFSAAGIVEEARKVLEAEESRVEELKERLTRQEGTQQEGTG